MRRAAFSLCSAALFALLVTPQAPQTLCRGFLPPNDMKIPVGCAESVKSVCPAGAAASKGLSEGKFNAVLDRIEAIYGPVVEARGATLEINRFWEDPTVNASTQRMGSRWIVNMYGGLARHEAVTQDGFALVVCHEIGHQVGGAPKVPGAWASIEGQSDYFSALKCMRQVFADAASKGFTRKPGSDPTAEKACAEQYKTSAGKALCLRSAMAGLSVTGLFQALHNEDTAPQLDTPDTSVVSQTDSEHPATQCRLDTYFQGSLCTKPASEAVSDKNPAAGTCTRSQGYSVGLRPLCWYKPPASERSLDIARFGAPAAQAREALSKSDAFRSLSEGSGLWQ
ncbi:MAG: hypothetical protein HY922_06185 [Elusimicrobia bacterium]|nr:hypothetical protein [Elusimicrobiota bacterium]